MMDIGQAVNAMRGGERVARPGWNGKGMWLAIEEPGSGSSMDVPFIYITPADGRRVPWFASQVDLLAQDWQVVGRDG